MLPHNIDSLAHAYLTALAFTEAPERHVAAGPFDVSRFHFTASDRAFARDHVREFLGYARDDKDCGGIVWTAEHMHALAYARNGHGIGFDSVDGLSTPAGMALDAVAHTMGRVDVLFRKRGEKIHMMFA